MVRSRRLRQWTIFAAVLALLLKGAVPLFATAAAGLQGVSVADVCSVYGVRTVASNGQPAGHDAHAHHRHHGDAGGDRDPSRGPHSDAAHGGEHCALTALAALGPPDVAPVALPTAAAHPEVARVATAASIPNAPAEWAARLCHAPPVGQVLTIDA